MYTHPHTSKRIIVSLVLGFGAAAQAAPVGIGVGAGSGMSIGGITGGALNHPIGLGTSASAGGNIQIGTAGISAGAGSAMNAMVGSAGFVSVPDATVDTSAFETIGMRQSRLADAHTAGVLIGNSKTAAAGTDDVSPNGAAAISAATSENHGKMTTDVQTALAANDKALSKAKARAKTLSTEQQAEFTAAMKETAAREKTVKKDLKTAQKASVEGWSDAHAQLATDYHAYAQSVQRAQTISSGASVSAQSQTQATSRSASKPTPLSSESQMTAVARSMTTASRSGGAAIDGSSSSDMASAVRRGNTSTEVADSTTTGASAAAKPKF